MNKMNKSSLLWEGVRPFYTARGRYVWMWDNTLIHARSTFGFTLDTYNFGVSVGHLSQQSQGVFLRSWSKDQAIIKLDNKKTAKKLPQSIIHQMFNHIRSIF